MHEICLISNQIWHEGDVDKFPHLQPGCAFNRAFYDEHTGEIWGRRLVVGAKKTVWLYHPGDPKQKDLTLPYEWYPEYEVPAGLLAALLTFYATNISELVELVNQGESQ